MKKSWFSFLVIGLVTLSFTTGSCIAHIHGNGKVVKEERNITGFDEIAVSTGIELVINQDTFEKVVVEADENIQKILKTELKGEKLKIYLEEGVNYAKRMKVYVTVKQLKSMEASAGSEVKTSGKINSESLKIHSSSGSEVNMEVGCTFVSADSSSGSELTVSGTTISLKGDSSSGSELKLSNLIAEKGEVSASSGSELNVHTTKEIKAHASSGAEIDVYGNPALRDTNSSSGGDINFR